MHAGLLQTGLPLATTRGQSSPSRGCRCTRVVAVSLGTPLTFSKHTESELLQDFNSFVCLDGDNQSIVKES